MDCYAAGLPYGHVNAVRSFLALREKLRLNCQPITGSFAVKLTLRGYKRKTPTETVRTPLSRQELNQLLTSDLPGSKKLHFLLGYLFLLRTSEVQAIMKGDSRVEKTPKGWTVFLHRSKADKFARGVSVFFPNDCMPADLALSLHNLLPLKKKAAEHEPHSINAAIKLTLGDNFVFHCLRHGRATDLHNAGWPIAKLQVLGRWASRSALVCYLH